MYNYMVQPRLARASDLFKATLKFRLYIFATYELSSSHQSEGISEHEGRLIHGNE